MKTPKYCLVCPKGMETLVASFCLPFGTLVRTRAGMVILETNQITTISKLCGGIDYVLEILYEGSSEKISCSTKSPNFSLITIKNDEVGSQQILRNHIISLLKPSKWDTKHAGIHLIAVVYKDEVIIGSDIYKKDLGKRDYKAYYRQPSLRGTLGWGLWQLLSMTAEKVAWCPAAIDGTLPIEAALIKKNLGSKEVLIHAWATASGIKAAQANAKLAGVNSLISFANLSADWATTRFSHGSIDLVACTLPVPTHNPKEIRFFYTDLLEQSKYALSPKGKLGVISTNISLFAEEARRYGFTKKEEQMWWMGKQSLTVQIYTP